MESYEKKYKELESKIKKAYLYAQTDSTKAVLEEILPELKDNDDRIRKALITYFQRFPYPYGGIESAGTNAKEALARLEKQESVEEIVARCKDSWYNEGKIAGMAEGLSDDEKYQQGWHDALEKQNEQNPAWSQEDERIALAIEQLCNCASLLNILPVKINKVRQWLKSLKDRVQPQKQWKPSEEQIQCLHDAIEHYHTNGYPASKLNELYEQMSKIYKL